MGGENWSYGWGPQDDTASIATIHRSIELGINWIDTAPLYGLGHAEEVIAKALADVPVAQRPYVFTKCGFPWREDGQVYLCLDPALLRRELEASLRRLRVETIDLYQIHWPALDRNPVDRQALEAAWRQLCAFQREGKVRYIGVCNFDVSELELIAPLGPLASLQPPYSLLRRHAAQQILPWCRAHEVGVITYSPMESGLLTGALTRTDIANLPAKDWRRRSPLFTEPALSKGLEVVELLRAIGARHGRSPAEVAIAWILNNPAVTGAIVGARSASEIEGLIEVGTFRLSASEIEEIERALPPSF
jgi:aryl-alcohol dehydrogenase-like predicted oxidoreductase